MFQALQSDWSDHVIDECGLHYGCDTGAAASHHISSDL